MEDAPAGYLLEDVECPVPVGAPVAASGRPSVALIDGFAVTAEATEGGICRVAGELAPRRTGAAPAPAEDVDEPRRTDSSPPPAASESPSAWRVDVGAILPEGCACVLPLDDITIVGSREIRVDRAPREGHGLETLPPTPAGTRPRIPVVFPRGSYLDARLRTMLLAAGVTRVSIVPPPSVAFALIGDELSEPGPSGDPASVPDVLGRAFDESIRSLGPSPTAFGILADLPGAIDAALVRAKERHVELLVLAGGLGDGLADRTAEGLRKAGALPLLEARVAGLSGHLLHARVHGLDVIALGGSPRTALAQLDLFVRPAILASQAAPRRVWDWSRFPRPVSCPPASDPAGWRVLPARRRIPPTGGGDIEAWPGTSPWIPIEPGQEGWAVLPPAASAAPSPGQEAYFQPCQPCSW